MSSSYKISLEQIEQYQKDGAIYLPKVFDDKWLNAAKIAIQKVMEDPSQYGESLRYDGIFFNNNFKV